MPWEEGTGLQGHTTRVGAECLLQARFHMFDSQQGKPITDISETPPECPLDILKLTGNEIQMRKPNCGTVRPEFESWRCVVLGKRLPHSVPQIPCLQN